VVKQLIEASPEIAAAYENQELRYNSLVAAAQEKHGQDVCVIPYNDWFLRIFTGMNANVDILKK